MNELLILAVNVIESFVISYTQSKDSSSDQAQKPKLDLKDESDKDVVFVASLVACLANIAARDIGRAELIANKRVWKLVQAIVQIIGECKL